MSKKSIIKIVIVIVCIGLVMFYFDSIFVKNQKKPLFCFELKTMSDGKSKEYVGLLYKVYKYVGSEDIYEYDMVNIFAPFDENRLLELNDNNEVIEHELTGTMSIVTSTPRKDNKDKYPMGDIITSTAELANFLTPEDKSSIEKYDKSFFKDKVLVACLVQEDSSNVEYKITKLTKKAALITAELERTTSSNDGKLTHNYVLIEVDKEFFTDFDYQTDVIVK